jgi:WNK lysine deficient protein kinase
MANKLCRNICISQCIIAPNFSVAWHLCSTTFFLSMRFGPEGRSSSRSPRIAELQSNVKSSPHQRQGSMSPHAGRPRRRNDEDDRPGRMSRRNRSMVDMRSQLLHRTLVEELNRRMFFNTVAAVENIGFRAPPGYSSPSSSSGPGRVDRRRRSKEDDKNHRYYML